MRIPHPDQLRTDTLSDRVADAISGWFGSMRCFYTLIVWQLGWMALASVGAWWFAADKYPFAFLLFCSNLIQLLALPVLGVATNRADIKRSAKADADHTALTAIFEKVCDVEALLSEER